MNHIENRCQVIGMVAAIGLSTRWLLLAAVIAPLVVIGSSNGHADNLTNSTAVTHEAKGAGSQLTFELRDGSRIMCKCLDDPLHFHSVSLGEVKLPISDIHSIEFAANEDDGGNTAQLTATNGDVLDIEFTAASLHVETGFGKSELPVKKIRSIKVSSTSLVALNGQLHPGLVSLWAGNGNGADSIGTNNAIVPPNVTYTTAKVGEGFNLDGRDNRILVPDAPELNFGAGKNFSITGWVQQGVPFSSTSGDVTSFVDKRYVPNLYQCKGYEFNLFQGRIHCRISDSMKGNGEEWGPAGPDLRDGKFHFIALCVERNSPVGGKMYVDGTLVMTFDPSGVPGDLSNDQPLRIGNHPLDPQCQAFFLGVINEVAVFNEAISSAEIQKIYNEQYAGIELSQLPVLPCIKSASKSTVTSANEKGSQLTIELRDGSRLVGKSLDDPLKFHSTTLGDLQLPVASIGSVRFTDNGINNAQLKATNGDALDVQFITTTLHVETEFGKSELPVKLILSIKVTAPGTSAQNQQFSLRLLAMRADNGSTEVSDRANITSVPVHVNYEMKIPSKCSCAI